MEKFEHRAVIKFLSKKGLKPNAIETEMQEVYGTSTPSLSTIRRWHNEFKRGRESLEDDERSGRPSTSINTETIEAVQQLVESDRRIRIANIAYLLKISRGSIGTILHEHLGYNKVSARWVPRMLTNDHKQNRVNCSRELLALYTADQESFEKRIITGDECWIYHYDPETKLDSMEWRLSDEEAPRKFKQVKSGGKILGCFFGIAKDWYMLSICELETVTGIRYAEQLKKLRAALIQKRRGKVRNLPRLLHDNAPAHTSEVALHAAHQCGYQILSHPPYSPDLAPSDFYLFRLMKKPLRGKRFGTDNEVIEAVEQWFSDMPKEFFQSGIRECRERWQKCIEKAGDYVEK